METTKTLNKEFNVSIKDFQIIKSASLTFLPGLNCIIGQSNNGKSAILRATKAAIYNIAGTTSVRFGCNSYAVGIQANGHTIIFQKGATSAYKIDGMTISKIGRTQIPEVAEALQIKELNLNGSNEDINFLDQMEKPFLLDRSETDLFRFIVDSGKDSNVTLALKSLSQDRQQLTRDITMTEGKLEQVEQVLKEQEETLKVSEDRLVLYQNVIDLGPKVSRVKDITNLKNILLEQSQEYNGLKEVSSKTNTLLDLIDPNVDKINNTIKKRDLLNLISSSITKASEDKAQLELTKERLAKIDGTRLTELTNKLKAISILYAEHMNIDKELNALRTKVFPEVTPEFNSNVERLSMISGLIDKINEDQTQLSNHKSLLDTICVDLEASQKEINDLGVCPMCGKPLHV